MALIPPLSSRSGLLEVLLGTQDNSILVVDENEVEDQLMQDRIGAPIIKIAVAPNGRFLACYRKDGILTVMSSSFTSKVLDFDTKSISKPLDITWCGEDAVLLVWKNTGIVMVGPYGDWLNFSYDDQVHLISEPDCCRIITSTSCEILQRVPSSTEAIRRIGSTDPAALLYDAMEAFDDGDPKSDENIRSIAASNQLEDAVKSCINAAAAEFDISKQQSFIKAASYGKAFCYDMDPSDFVDTARKLRVLNAVRRHEIGLPLTLQQYNRLTPEILVNRLTYRGHHYLALKICELLRLKNERVLIHWACEKVRKLASQNVPDETIKETIKKKLEPYPRISYLDVASAAYQMGKRRLATMILDMEQQAADQVPLLLSMQEEELALQKAINSEDTDLIYLTLIHLEKSRGDIDSFYRLIYSHAEAANLLKIYYRNKVTNSDKSLLHNLLVFGKNYLEAGTACVNQAYLQTGVGKEVSKMQLIKEAVSLFGQGRDIGFSKAMTEEQVDLLDFQQTLSLRSDRNFADLSISETINNLVVLSMQNPSDTARWENEIAKIVKKFKVSEKMLWYIKLHCYSRAGQWALLLKFANERKSPIGYKPFAIALIK
jgi:vacuolar protein sorting-associated protein 16